jgi:hypothetical protein
MRCRIKPYWIKAAALRAAAPGRARAGRAAWRPVPPQRAGQGGLHLLISAVQRVAHECRESRALSEAAEGGQLVALPRRRSLRQRVCVGSAPPAIGRPALGLGVRCGCPSDRRICPCGMTAKSPSGRNLSCCRVIRLVRKAMPPAGTSGSRVDASA